MDLVLAGCQSGDEGKGKFTDVFAADAQLVVRYQGGPHTGHTVIAGGETYRFVQVPAGLLQGCTGVLGNGCVVEPCDMVREIEALEARGWSVPLRISETAHVIFPYHRAQDEVLERWRGSAVAVSADTGFRLGVGQLGSTRRGVGPCREDKIARIGLRLIDLLDIDLLRARLSRLVVLKQRLIENAFALPLTELASYQPDDWDADALADRYHAAGLRLAPCLADIASLLNQARRLGHHILYEGAQAVALDVEHGTYPFCSSGFSAANGVTVGTGSSPALDFRVFGVMKAYMSQVGGGPLPTELDGELAEHIVRRGNEFGSVTGRRRRVGWLDLPLCRRALEVDRFSHLCISAIDVLAGLPSVRIAVGYEVNGRTLDRYPVDLALAAAVQPVYHELPGWPDADWPAVARAGDAALPAQAQEYLRFVADFLGVEIAAISVGPAREQTMVTQSPFDRARRSVSA
jgi:adenylosuccinate synthase